MKKEILIWEPFWQRVRLVSVGKESREHHTSLNLFDTLYIASRIQHNAVPGEKPRCRIMVSFRIYLGHAPRGSPEDAGVDFEATCLSRK